MAHASMIANAAGLTGLTLTVILWATQRQRSRFVRAHIVQALVYQAGTLLGVVLLMLLWSGCLLLSLLPAALRPDLYRDGALPDTFWIALFGLVLPIGYGVVATLYALYGAYQVYRGNRFAYPLAGRLVARDLEASPSGAPTSTTPPPDTAPAPPLPSPGSAVAMQPPVRSERPAPPIAPAPSPPLSDSPVATQSPTLSPSATPAPMAVPQTSTEGKEGAPALPAVSSLSVATTATAVSTPSSLSEVPPAVTSDESAMPAEGGAPPISSASDVVEVVPVQDALDQGSRPTDRVAAPDDASSSDQPPEAR